MGATIREEHRRRGVVGWIFLLIFWTFNIVMVTIFAVGIDGAGSVPDAASEAQRAGHMLGAVIGVGMLVAIWAAGVVILGAMVLLTRGRKIIVERVAE